VTQLTHCSPASSRVDNRRSRAATSLPSRHPRRDDWRHRSRSGRSPSDAPPGPGRSDPEHDVRAKRHPCPGGGAYRDHRHIKQRLDREFWATSPSSSSPTTPRTRTRSAAGASSSWRFHRTDAAVRLELQVSGPEVILRMIDGEVPRPYERITVDIPGRTSSGPGPGGPR